MGSAWSYHAGADLYLFDPSVERVRQLDVVLPSLRTQRNRKFVFAGSYLDSYTLHPKGYVVALTTRGKAFTMGNWEGPVLNTANLTVCAIVSWNGSTTASV